MKEKRGEPGGLEGIQKTMVTNFRASQSSCRVGQDKNTVVIAHRNLWASMGGILKALK